MTLRISLYGATMLLSFLTASGCGTSGQNGNGQAVVIDSDKSRENTDSLIHLDLNRPGIEQAIDARNAGSASPRFVQIEVTQVTNPKKHPLTIEVHFRSNISNAPIYLGSFSLYPSDNPGKFLVATQGRVTGGGAIILSLTTPDQIDSGDVIRVAVKPFTLITS